MLKFVNGQAATQTYSVAVLNIIVLCDATASQPLVGLLNVSIEINYFTVTLTRRNALLQSLIIC